MLKKRALIGLLTVAAICALVISFWPSQPRAKYVFYFIGDGMGMVQVHAAEAYLASLEDNDTEPGRAGRQVNGLKAKPLAMIGFPVKTMVTTFAANRFITCSAAAGTALACGQKTSISTIAMDPDKKIAYPSIAELAHTRGMNVGIVTNVSLDHATPAVFYAHVPDRNMYHDIGHELVTSGFEYYGGGSFINPDGPKGNIYAAAAANGYTLARTRADLQAAKPGQKILACVNAADAVKELDYEIDRQQEQVSLAELTRRGIELLDNPAGPGANKNGFFMMIEGGKIDWAGHANDARTLIDEVIAFDRAIQEAVKFYQKHPRETLIIVTADHETGGMALGSSGAYYESSLELLAGQTESFFNFDKRIREFIAKQPTADISGSELETMIQTGFGIVYDNSSVYEKKLMEDAYDKTRKNISLSYDTYPEEYVLYGNQVPLTVTCCRILNRRSGISFSTYSHTAVPVPLFALGNQAFAFAGLSDNTEIVKPMAKAMGLKF